MIRFPWKRIYPQREYRSPADGGISDVSVQLSVLVGEYRNESLRWTGDTADLLWANAWQLDTVRMNVIRSITSADDGRQWLNAGWTILNLYQYERSQRNHPAGKLRNVER